MSDQKQLDQTQETTSVNVPSVSEQPDSDQTVPLSDSSSYSHLPAYEVPASAFRVCGSDGWPLDM